MADQQLNETDVAPGSEPDADRLKLFSFLVFSKLEGAMTAGMIHLGDRLGLYRALAAAGAAITTDELAERTGLHERWVREWIHNQAAAKLITSSLDGGARRFSLTPEAVAVLAAPEHPAFGMGMFHDLPEMMQTLDAMPQSFRTGVGHDYDSRGPDSAISLERSFEPWNRANLVPTVVPALDGVVEKLARGVIVADVGCGAGGAVLLIAEAFQASEVHGYDISQHALERAEERKASAGLANAHFHDARVDPLPTDNSVDVILTIDCIHDMTDPQGMIDAVRKAIAPDGTWLLVDIKARDTFEENAAKNPMAPMMYGISVLSCMSSGLSEPGGAGLGTLGLPPSKAEEMARAAGFTSFRRLDVDHPVNAFYEIRP